ncbi:RrF2 family transcriptional regulator [Exiguobacterium sp. A1_3_1]|uniref:RrF2 family transcriptional regulator n=1 Tax=Exiguobacterium sp. A1_3_1 TaxID=2651871 RepID=UPI003B984C4C
MRLTAAIKYAITAVLYVGLKSREEHISPSKYIKIKEISRQCGITHNHLIKVIHRLGKSDIIITMRGKSGGVMLGKELFDISIADVIRVFYDETTLKINETFYNDVLFTLQVPLVDAQRSYLKTLDQVSFESLVKELDDHLKMSY